MAVLGRDAIQRARRLGAAFGQLGVRQLAQREVLRLVARGLTSSAIAEQLFTSERTVEKHRSDIMNKLQLDSPFGLLRYALQ